MIIMCLDTSICVPHIVSLSTIPHAQFTKLTFNRSSTLLLSPLRIVSGSPSLWLYIMHWTSMRVRLPNERRFWFTWSVGGRERWERESEWRGEGRGAGRERRGEGEDVYSTVNQPYLQVHTHISFHTLNRITKLLQSFLWPLQPSRV